MEILLSAGTSAAPPQAAPAPCPRPARISHPAWCFPGCAQRPTPTRN